MLKLNQKLCFIILVVVLLFSTTPAAFAANKSASYNLSNGALTLTAKNGDIRVYGSYDGYGAGIIVKDGYKGTITLDNVTIDAKKIEIDYSDYKGSSYGETYSAIYIEIETKVIINTVGTNEIYGEHIGINSRSQEDFLLTGTGTLEIETHSNSITNYASSDNAKLIIDVESVFSGGIEAKNIIINKRTVASGYSGIEAGYITINAETIATGNNSGDSSK